MKHEFTEDDLRQALRHTAYMDDGLRINTPAWVEDNDEVDTEQVDVFRAILDALPEPEPAPVADEWANKTFIAYEDVRKGDHVRIAVGIANGVETTVERIDARGIRWEFGTLLKRDISSIVLLKAAPRHPDPAEHPVIVGVVTRDGSNHDFGVRNWSNYHVYSNGQSEGFLNSDQITDWEPAKIVRIEEK